MDRTAKSGNAFIEHPSGVIQLRAISMSPLTVLGLLAVSTLANPLPTQAGQGTTPSAALITTAPFLAPRDEPSNCVLITLGATVITSRVGTYHITMSPSSGWLTCSCDNDIRVEAISTPGDDGAESIYCRTDTTYTTTGVQAVVTPTGTPGDPDNAAVSTSAVCHESAKC